MKIGELASLTDISPESIRYYEKIGLIATTERSQSGQRIYHRSHLSRLKSIKRMRRLEFSLKEIALLLDFQSNAKNYTKDEIKVFVAEHVAKLDEILENLTSIRSELKHLVNQCEGDKSSANDCPILNNLTYEKS